MKKFLFLSLFMAACNSSPASTNQPTTQVERAVQLGCEQDYSHCVNQCQHVSTSSEENYNCMESCKATAKKCGR